MSENGMNRESYMKWLTDHGRVQGGRPHDNWRNRLQYFAWLESKEGLVPIFKKVRSGPSA